MTEPKKKHPGRWKAGESGNPAGRPPGVGEVSKLRAAIDERVPDLLAAMMTRALDGDAGAARLLLERAIAPLKAAPCFHLWPLVSLPQDKGPCCWVPLVRWHA